MKFFIRILLLISLSLGLFSCTRLNWAVRFADFYITNQIDDYLDLTSAQKKTTKAEVQKVILDVRTQDFPILADFLDQIAARIQVSQSLEKKWLDEWQDQGTQIFLRSLQRFEPLSLSLLSSLSKEQEKQFIKEFNRRTEKLRQEVSTPDRALKKDRERTVRWISLFVTDLNKKQRDKIEEFVKDNPASFEDELNNRSHLLDSLISTSGDQRRIWIQAFMKDPNTHRTTRALESSKDRQERMKRLMIQLWEDLSEKQRIKVRENLKEKAAEFSRLSS